MAKGRDQQQPDDSVRIVNPLAHTFEAADGDVTPSAGAPDERKWNETGGSPDIVAAKADEEHCEARFPRCCRSRGRLLLPTLLPAACVPWRPVVADRGEFSFLLHFWSKESSLVLVGVLVLFLDVVSWWLIYSAVEHNTRPSGWGPMYGQVSPTQ